MKSTSCKRQKQAMIFWGLKIYNMIFTDTYCVQCQFKLGVLHSPRLVLDSEDFVTFLVIMRSLSSKEYIFFPDRYRSFFLYEDQFFSTQFCYYNAKSFTFYDIKVCFVTFHRSLAHVSIFCWDKQVSICRLQSQTQRNRSIFVIKLRCIFLYVFEISIDFLKNVLRYES